VTDADIIDASLSSQGSSADFTDRKLSNCVQGRSLVASREWLELKVA